MALSNFPSSICLIMLTLTIPMIVAHNTPQNYVDAHNAVRAEVGADPVFWDEELAKYAQNYLDSKISTCEMVHSNGSYGENLATLDGLLTAAAAVKAWADEKKYYDHNSNKCVGGECRHYTQLVWKNSFLIGCANIKCKNNWSLVSCNYSPAGSALLRPLPGANS
ncbi:hypothetical protein Csa_017290 [Cucumis sativus]|nr:hypothetical protein Csa_017290 [Cucumis sativus]